MQKRYYKFIKNMKTILDRILGKVGITLKTLDEIEKETEKALNFKKEHTKKNVFNFTNDNNFEFILGENNKITTEVILFEDGLRGDRGLLINKGATLKAVQLWESGNYDTEWATEMLPNSPRTMLPINDTHISYNESIILGLLLGGITNIRTEQYEEGKYRAIATIELDKRDPVVAKLLLLQEVHGSAIFSVSAEIQINGNSVEMSNGLIIVSDFIFTGMGIVITPANVTSYKTLEFNNLDNLNKINMESIGDKQEIVTEATKEAEVKAEEVVEVKATEPEAEVVKAEVIDPVAEIAKAEAEATTEPKVEVEVSTTDTVVEILQGKIAEIEAINKTLETEKTELSLKLDTIFSEFNALKKKNEEYSNALSIIGEKNSPQVVGVAKRHYADFI